MSSGPTSPPETSGVESCFVSSSLCNSQDAHAEEYGHVRHIEDSRPQRPKPDIQEVDDAPTCEAVGQIGCAARDEKAETHERKA